MSEYEGALLKDKKIGFGMYLGVEAIMFATLFTNYIIFTPSPHGPQPGELFEAKSLILSSFFLLSSSFTLIGAERFLSKGKKLGFLIGLGITFLFAAIFLGLEVKEFYKYVSEGNGVSANNFMASYFVLVGLHAAHVAFGLGWMAALFTNWMRNIQKHLYHEKLKIFSYYWHFVDVMWVVIILVVYLRFLI
ncbi:cytochrome c oxidase subunit 3 [Aciduricibacillus chroicocephali]|uniref:Cytochrome c oxidase subunit 3 n=1 Tax=Aciduricibacillus chroicocephali TaxID=3054939 RepID=A0ABY9KTV7_9BACI|nr:cytochrome c oxidase subunit 3 [Bacillaceae bacterium 44XB]